MSERAPGLTFPPRFEPLSPLGKGGGGEVWAVRDRITDRTVALKALGENASEAEVLALVREAVALTGVEGLGVPRVLRFGRLEDQAGSEGGGRSYMVRELVEGKSLADLLAKGGDARRLLSAVARTIDQLTRLHRALLFHGDLKPANIIVGDDGRASLVDLGLAAKWREGGARAEGLTPRYAAPELFEGAPLTVRAEVFALGATIEEVLAATTAGLSANAREALGELVARAKARDPGARFPSADELGSALRSAAGLDAPGVESHGARGAAWPVGGLDAAANVLFAQIAALPPGGGIVVTGPRSSGKSTLLRRVAWTLGVERPVAWIEAHDVCKVDEALAIELAGLDADPRATAGAVVLIDDAERLDGAALARVEAVRSKGGKLVVALGDAAAGSAFAGRTLELFAIPPLSNELAGELVRRTVPSLSDAVVSHVVARAEGWPGRLRAIVGKLEGAPVVSPADVDRLLTDDGPPVTGRSDLQRLLDRGHFDEAAEVLARFTHDPSAAIAIARARLWTNRGDTARSIAELARVREEVEAAIDPELRAGFALAWARAQLRAGDYAEAEASAREGAERLGVGPEVVERTQPSRADEAGPASILDDRFGASAAKRGSGSVREMPSSLGRLAAELVAVRGLALSLASRHAEARASLDHAVRLARDVAEPRILSVALGSLAFALQRDDHLTEAKAAYEEALVAAEEAGDAGSVATTRLNLAGIAKTQGDLAAALRNFEAAVDMGRRSGRVATLRQALLNLANLDLYVGRVARARVSIDALAEERGDLPPQLEAQLLALEAEWAARSGDLAAAERLCRECAEAYQAMRRSLDEVEARLEGVLFAVARPGAAVGVLRAEVRKAIELLGGGSAHRALLSLARGKLAALDGDEAGAREAYGEALDAAQSSGQKEWTFRALEARADLEQLAGHTVRARRDRESALVVLEEIAALLPRDLREVFWNDPRRQAIRATSLRDLGSVATSHTVVGPDRLARVLEVNRAIAGEHDLGRLLEKVTDHAIALLQAERGFVLLRSGYATNEPRPAEGGVAAMLSIHASRDKEGDDPHARFSQSIADKVISTGEPVVTSSAREDARMAGYVSVHQLMLQSVACVPIRARAGSVIGALYLETRLRAAQSFEGEIPTLSALADQVAIAIETARLVGENTRRAAELEKANLELAEARDKLEELLGHRTAQLAATRRDLKSARAVLRGHFGYEGLVGTSEAMRRVYALIDRVKETDVPVLITGESGTGKEVVARAIHNGGPRDKKPFLGLNCGAIPEHLLESELFGHVRGAFTGADRDRKGLFREATQGTILLDEIGEMPQKMQAGLLRVLQEKVVRPVGAAREEPVDTRVIAATHRDLSAMVEAGSFREDLYYRLHVIQVRVPPLRERLEDLPILIDHFLGIFAARYSRERRSVSRAALKRLQAFSWPGNVRQLENVLLNAWVLSDGPELDIDDFELPSARAPKSAEPIAPALPLDASRGGQTSLDDHKADERERIVAALQRCNWNRVKAAQVVGLPRRTFYRRLKEYGIQ